MTDFSVGLSSLALLFSIFAIYLNLVRFSLQLDMSITDILPNTTNAEDFSMFLVRLVIVNRASVSRTACGIKIYLPRKYRKVCSIEPILHQYALSGQNEISSTSYPMTIDEKAKLLGDSIFQLPLDIYLGQSTTRWIALKVSRKCLSQQGYGSMKCHLRLLNVYGKPLTKKVGLTLKFLPVPKDSLVGLPQNS